MKKNKKVLLIIIILLFDVIISIFLRYIFNNYIFNILNILLCVICGYMISIVVYKK